MSLHRIPTDFFEGLSALPAGSYLEVETAGDGAERILYHLCRLVIPPVDQRQETTRAMILLDDLILPNLDEALATVIEDKARNVDEERA